MVTTGLWQGFGTDFFKATTTAHETGHLIGLWHPGRAPDLQTVGARPNVRLAVNFEPNCKPNYLSIMSYLFQGHGVLNFASDDPYLAFSSGENPDLDETKLKS